MLASPTATGLGPSCLAAVEAPTTPEIFEAYLERILAPTLKPGQKIVVVDNLSAHKGGRVREILHRVGYRRAGADAQGPQARTREALIEAMGKALDAVTEDDACGFFGHCGYRTTAQLL